MQGGSTASQNRKYIIFARANPGPISGVNCHGRGSWAIATAEAVFQRAIIDFKTI